MDGKAEFEKHLRGYFNVEKDEEGYYTNADTQNMYASYLAGVKSQQARIDALEAKIEELEGDLRTRCNE